MARQFEGKTVFVTGGGTGIGQATAFAFAAEGAVVTVAGRSENALRDTVAEIVARGGHARYAICDVTDEAVVKAAVTVAIGDSGRLDVAVNSAGIDGGNLTYATVEYSRTKRLCCSRQQPCRSNRYAAHGDRPDRRDLCQAITYRSGDWAEDARFSGASCPFTWADFPETGCHAERSTVL
jgi:NAD(P)-dependent dehydrogenase (short-subunit alcohol dehydrogenase family)